MRGVYRVQESLQGSGEEFTGFRRVLRFRRGVCWVEESLQGSGEFTGFRRVYKVRESLQSSGEFTGFKRVYRVKGRSLQGLG